MKLLPLTSAVSLSPYSFFIGDVYLYGTKNLFSDCKVCTLALYIKTGEEKNSGIKDSLGQIAKFVNNSFQ